MKLESVEVHATKAVFVAPRDVLERFVRLTFKLAGHWFDVEGLALGTLAGNGQCLFNMKFGALQASTLRRLEDALKGAPTTNRLHGAKDTFRVRRLTELKY